MASKMLSLLGLCRKAGKLELGEAPSLIAIKSRLCRLLVYAQDASDGTVRRALFQCQLYQCPALCLPVDKETLGALFGRASVALAVITDAGLAISFLRTAEQEGLGPFLQWIDAIGSSKKKSNKKSNRARRR